MKKILISLCIIIPALALVFGIGSLVFYSDSKREDITLITGQTGGDCDNTQIQTTHSCNENHGNETTADTEEALTIGELLSVVSFDGISNYTFYKMPEYEKKYFDGAATAAFILEYLYYYGKSEQTDVIPDNEYGFHFTLFSGDQEYKLSVLDRYVRFSLGGKVWCFYTGHEFYTRFSPKYLSHFQCVPPVDENIPEEIIRFNPETVHLEYAQDIREAINGFAYSDYTLGDEILLNKNGELEQSYMVNDSTRKIIQECLDITDTRDKDIEKGKREVSFTLYNFGQSYNVSFNSNGYTYISQGDFEKCFHNVGAYQMFTLKMLKNSILGEESTRYEETETEIFLPPGFDLVKILDESETLGDFCDYSMYYSVQFSQWVIFREQGNQDMKHSIGVDGHKLINELIISNYDKKAENRSSQTDEVLIFESSFNGEKGIISTVLCSDGYLYITCEHVTKGYNIGIDAYNKFMKDFERCSCLWTPEHPVTIG